MQQKRSWDSINAVEDGLNGAKRRPAILTGQGTPEVEIAAGRYKTKMCKFFMEGACQRGDQCTFAHDEQELATGSGGELAEGVATVDAPLEEFAEVTEAAYPEEYAGHAQDAPELPPNYKTVPCKFFALGQCQRGEACTFIHEELVQETYAMPEEIIAPEVPHNYKTVPCKFFPLGKCDRGEACTFIHEWHEPPQANPKAWQKGASSGKSFTPAVGAPMPRTSTWPDQSKGVGKKAISVSPAPAYMPTYGKGPALSKGKGGETFRSWSAPLYSPLPIGKAPPGGKGYSAFQGYSAAPSYNAVQTYGHWASRPTPLLSQQQPQPHRYKTEMCKFFPLGQCQRGEACTYAHSNEELN